MGACCTDCAQDIDQRTVARKVGSPSAGRCGVAALQALAGNQATARWVQRRAVLPNRGGTAVASAPSEPSMVQRLVGDASEQPTLALGANGAPVVELQQHLNAGGADPPLVADGHFGPLTKTAVVAFQVANSLVPDGIAGPRTWAALVPEANGTEPEPPAAAADLEALGLGPANSNSPGTEELTAAPPAPGVDEPAAAVAAPPLAVPERNSTCPPYTGEELAASKASGGRTHDFGAAADQLPSLAALLFDFEVGKAAVRERHDDLIRDVIARFRLDQPDPLTKIEIIIGHSDCVGFSGGPEVSSGVNASLRKQRALQVALRFDQLGALLRNIDPDPAAGGSRGPGDDASPEGRALNRSVLLQLPPSTPPGIVIPGPNTGTDPGPPLCRDGGVASKNWELQGVASAGFPIGIDFEGMAFILHNVDSGTRHPAIFTGSGGGAGTPTAAIDFPSREPFQTLLDQPVCHGDFDGPAFVSTVEGNLPLPAPPIGFELGNILLIVPTDPSQIDIGGLQVGIGLAGGLGPGTFIVLESI